MRRNGDSSFGSGKCIVERYVENHRHSHCADKVQHRADQQQDSCSALLLTDGVQCEDYDETAVPRNSKRKIGLMMVTLISCIAAMPCSGGSRVKAFITEFEKAKGSPAMRPDPTAASTVIGRMY